MMLLRLISQLKFFMLFLPGILCAQETTKIRLLPHWLYQAQFAGYIMAKEKGFYSRYNLDVEIIPGGPNKPVMPALENRDADIVVGFLSSAIKSRAAGLHVVNIGQISQRTALMFVAKQGKGITDPQHFNGKKIGIWYSDFQELPLAFLAKYKIECEIVPVHSTINMFLWDAIDLMCIMWYNEYHQVINAGLNEDEIVVFDFFDHDLDFPEDGIYCMEEWLIENPQAARDFVKATAEGWRYAMQNQKEALDTIMAYMKKYHVPSNISHQKWMLNRMKDVILEGRDEISTLLQVDDYMRTAKVLKEAGAIDVIPAYQDFFKGE